MTLPSPSIERKWEDINRSFQQVCAQSGNPIYLRILDIQKNRYSPEGKTFTRQFVEKSRKRRRDGAIELRYVQARNGYIAVSCPWELLGPENTVTDRYHIEQERDMKKICRPQDVVLDRVIKFADAEGLPFWIDKLCIEQLEGTDEKEIAIQSMHLIYKESTLSLGLLFVRLDSEEQVRRLHDLMSGSCVSEGNGQEYKLVPSPKKAREVLDVLDLIVKDAWWERAWIFQEFIQQPGITPEEKSLCDEILKKAGKYNILLSYLTAGNTLKSMSATIFENIGRRNIKCKSDILAIASNSCDYSERLNTRKLQQEEKSLSLAILALYLLNGEILRHESTTGNNPNIFEFLQHNTLAIEPPLPGKELTFIKHCRFPHVKLSPSGIQTEGIIWTLFKKINPHTFSQKPHKATNTPHLPEYLCEKIHKHSLWNPSPHQLTHHEHEALWLLVNRLLYKENNTYKHLAQFLISFLEDIAPAGYTEDWSWKHIMYTMARNVARGIRDNKQLHLGSIYCPERQSPYTAIFVRDSSNWHDGKRFVFTSWACADGAPGERPASCGSRYASLEIEHPESMGRVVVPKRWINGLCFFLNSDVREVVVPWPGWIGG